MTYQQPEDEPRRRSTPAPGQPYDPHNTYAPYQGAEPVVPGWRPPQPKKHRTRNILLAIVGGFVALIVIAGIASGGKTPAGSAPSSSTTTPAATGAYPGTVPSNTASADSPEAVSETTASQAPAITAQVTYHCTGSAPDGVDITYGPSGSEYSAHKLPFTKTTALDDSAEFYSLQAQLMGSGHVSCTTTVQTDDGTQTVSSSSAEGDYNIADTEVCSSWGGTWDSCS
jgi:hypothetical protein